MTGSTPEEIQKEIDEKEPTAAEKWEAKMDELTQDPLERFKLKQTQDLINTIGRCYGR